MRGHFISVMSKISQYTDLLCKSFNYFVLHQRTPLHLAAEQGRFENILGYLLDKGADINIKDNDGVNTCNYTVNNKV